MILLHAGRAGVISRIKDLDPTRKQDFVYLSEEDVYRCPADEKLKLLLHKRGERAAALLTTYVIELLDRL